MASGRRAGIAHLPGEMDKNPYARLLYGHLEELGFQPIQGGELSAAWLLRARERISVLHFHWDPRYHDRHSDTSSATRSWLALAPFAARLAIARTLGYRLAWTVHEVRRHETTSERLDRVFGWTLARFCHVLMAHDRATAERAELDLGIRRDRVEIVPHGSYIGVYPPGRPRAAVRAELGIAADAFAFLSFGHIRRYKQIDLLLRAFGALPPERVALVIAGSPWDADLRADVEAAAARDSRIKPILGFVPVERVAELFGACDAAVLARGDGWTSGSLILALSEGLPVIAAKTPTYEELLGDDAGWLFEPGDAASLGATLRAAAQAPAAARGKGLAARRRALELSWSEAAERTAQLLSGKAS